MKWSVLELNKYGAEPLMFSETLELTDDLKKRSSEILNASPIQIDGLVSSGKNEYILHYTLKTTLTVPSSRSLQPVELPLDLTIDELFMTPDQFSQRDPKIADEEILVLEQDTIDLATSVIDNILLAIPLQVLSEEEKQAQDLPKGSDWEVITEDAYQQKKAATDKLDPRLAKLSELFSDTSDSE